MGHPGHRPPAHRSRCSFTRRLRPRSWNCCSVRRCPAWARGVGCGEELRIWSVWFGAHCEHRTQPVSTRTKSAFKQIQDGYTVINAAAGKVFIVDGRGDYPIGAPETTPYPPPVASTILVAFRVFEWIKKKAGIDPTSNQPLFRWDFFWFWLWFLVLSIFKRIFFFLKNVACYWNAKQTLRCSGFNLFWVLGAPLLR